MTGIGGRVREARTRRVLTQDDLTRATGIPKATISRIETGKQQPHQSTIRKIAAALRVDPGWIVSGGRMRTADQIGPAGKAVA